MKTPSHSERRGLQKAFTLVELLVTIAIVIVLAALAVIGMRTASAHATAAIDANDMRSIGAAVVLYASDNNDFLPVTSGGVGPIFKSNTRSILRPLAPYFGSEDPEIDTFYPEFAAASWQSETQGDGGGPSLLVMHRVYSGFGKPDNPSRPEPNFTPFGYPYPPGKRDPMTLTAAMGRMSNPSSCLMLTEVDKLHPNFRGSNPGWFEALPEGMAHGDYRLGLYWDGHVSKLDIDLNFK